MCKNERREKSDCYFENLNLFGSNFLFVYLRLVFPLPILSNHQNDVILKLVND